MADAPEAPAPAPADESVANQPTTNPEPAQAEQKPATEMHGFSSEDLADMRKFLDNNGGWDKIKSRISNPEPKSSEKPAEMPQNSPEKPAEPTSQPTPPVQTPQGAITQAEFMAQQYFKALAGEEKYAPISKEIANGDLLKEMAGFNIRPLNQDGSINDAMVRRYLDLKAQTVPAQPTATEPNASTAPTVNYIEVGDKIENMEQAQAVFMQHGHPKRQDAMDFIRRQINPNSPIDKK